MNSIQKCITLMIISLVLCQSSYAMFYDNDDQSKKRKFGVFEEKLIESDDDYDGRQRKIVRYEEQPIDINHHIILFSGYEPINQDQFQFVFNAAQAEDLEKSKLAHCPYAKISCRMLDEYYPPSCTHHRFDRCWMPEQMPSRQIFWNELRSKPIQTIQQELFNYANQNLSVKKLEILLNKLSIFNEHDAAHIRCVITEILEDVQNNFTAPEKFFLYNIHAYQNAKMFCQKISALTLNGYSTCLFKLLLASNQALAHYRELAFISYHKGNYNKVVNIPQMVRFHKTMITSKGQSFLAWLILEQNAPIEWIRLFIGQVAWDKTAIYDAVKITKRNDILSEVQQFESACDQMFID